MKRQIEARKAIPFLSLFLIISMLVMFSTGAQGVTNALINAGYTADNFPIITGWDCDIVSVRNMLAGTQSMSVFEDTRTLAEQVVKMVIQYINGEVVEVNDRSTYDNGTGIIPAFLCAPAVYTVDDIPKLIETGYYTEADLK